MDKLPDLMLIHGYDIVQNGPERIQKAAPSIPILALSTLSPRSNIDDFERAGVSVLVIPSILTIQRLLSGEALLHKIASGETTTDGPYPSFKEIVKSLP